MPGDITIALPFTAALPHQAWVIPGIWLTKWPFLQWFKDTALFQKDNLGLLWQKVLQYVYPMWCGLFTAIFKQSFCCCGGHQTNQFLIGTVYYTTIVLSSSLLIRALHGFPLRSAIVLVGHFAAVPLVRTFCGCGGEWCFTSWMLPPPWSWVPKSWQRRPALHLELCLNLRSWVPSGCSSKSIVLP